MNHLAHTALLLDCQHPVLVASMKISFLDYFWSWVECLLVWLLPFVCLLTGFPTQETPYPTFSTYHQRFLGSKLTAKFMTDDFEPPVTETAITLPDVPITFSCNW